MGEYYMDEYDQYAEGKVHWNYSKSLQYLKQKAAQDAVAEFQQAHPDPSESKPMDVQ